MPWYASLTLLITTFLSVVAILANVGTTKDKHRIRFFAILAVIALGVSIINHLWVYAPGGCTVNIGGYHLCNKVMAKFEKNQNHEFRDMADLTYNYSACFAITIIDLNRKENYGICY